MWFKLATADFSDKNLGKMADIAGSWGVSYTLQGNISKNSCPPTVKMNDGKTQAAADFTATFTLGDGATLTSITANLKSSSAQLAQVTEGNSITVEAAKITGDIVITAIASGEGTEPETPPSDSTTPESLNDIAWEDMTYYDLFINNNRAPNINNNSMTNAYGNITYTDSAGSTTIKSDSTAADNYVPPYSLYVSGTSSQQAKSNKNYNNTTSYFLAANVKVTNYTKGYCGVIFGSNFDACASAVTDGYEVFSAIGDNSASSTSGTTALYIGSASSANLTGYINNPVIIDMSIFTTAPSLEELTTLYKNYTAKLIAG